jgi:hypothetical protein
MLESTIQYITSTAVHKYKTAEQENGEPHSNKIHTSSKHILHYFECLNGPDVHLLKTISYCCKSYTTNILHGVTTQKKIGRTSPCQ